MRQFILFMALFGLLFSVSAAFCQEEAEFEEDMEREMDMHHMRMEMEEREMDMRRAQIELRERDAEADFHQEMRGLELEERRMGLEHKRKWKKHHDDKGGAVLLAVLLIVNILLAVWVYQDIRKRNAGSGIWIVVTLLTGLFGTLVYSIVRLGESKQ